MGARVGGAKLRGLVRGGRGRRLSDARKETGRERGGAAGGRNSAAWFEAEGERDHSMRRKEPGREWGRALGGRNSAAWFEAEGECDLPMRWKEPGRERGPAPGARSARIPTWFCETWRGR